MPRRRTLEQMDKDAEALDLWLSGRTHRQISAAKGWKSSAAAHAAVKRALLDRQRNKLEQEEHFLAAVERIQAGLQRCQEIIDTRHYLAAPGGKIATAVDPESGEEFLVLDSGPKQRAITEQRHLNDQLIALMDLRPPAKKRVEVIMQDAVDRECAELVGELSNAGPAADRPGIRREP